MVQNTLKLLRRQEGKGDQGEISQGSDFLTNSKQSPNPFFLPHQTPSRAKEQMMYLMCKEETILKI